MCLSVSGGLPALPTLETMCMYTVYCASQTDLAEQLLIEIIKKVESDVENLWIAVSVSLQIMSQILIIEKLLGHECFTSRSLPKDTIAKLLFEK